MSLPMGECNVTLLIRHMPREFSDDDKLEFLRHFGAMSVKTVVVGGAKNEIVFATFPTASMTKAALLRLHQLEVLGRYLIVEYARSSVSMPVDPGSSFESKTEASLDEDKKQRLQDQFMRRLVSWSSKLNLSQPPPSHLRYQYPPPTPATLSNISRALSMYPRLYTQLLHLMNRMNLPPPFQDGYRTNSACDQSTQTDAVWREKSSSESELESEEEQLSITSDCLLSKRPPPRRKINPIKRPRFIKPTVPVESAASTSIPLRPEEVFEKSETEVLSRKIELRLVGSLPLDKEESDFPNDPSTADPAGFGVIHPPLKPDSSDGNKTGESSEIVGDNSVITAEELASNRIPTKDLQILPVFKNYSPGAPSCRLYVKNVSKHAVARDLHFIYRRFLKSSLDDDDEANLNMFDVRLMTEGRMKGQAFITLPSVKLAQEALTETNGYILKDRPLVVQFARSATAASSSTSTNRQESS
ncbi:RNA-binding region-containing protein 3 [Thrips palmi]|uniref:RNA-binding region-containing protein 3 n=1 Tax=Thrips palmi TaxID=161013 RepID=A0A6P8YW48_THRPL|nr:RNA-binding region-containing protein 3 [Thrips palmi]